jgi:hypothetical protein
VGTGVTRGTAAPPRTGCRRLAGSALAVLALALAPWLLAGCAGQEQSGTTSARVSTWVSGAAGGAAIGTLRVDSANIDQALLHHDSPAAIKTVCALLTNDAETAIGDLPTPDSQLTADLNRAYEKGAAAGDDCYQGAGGERPLLRRSTTERNELLPLLTAAVDRIRSLTGHTPSTSTTAPSGSCSDPFGGCN